MEGLLIENSKLIKYSGSSETVVIPDGVATIGKDAFRNNREIKSVIIPDSVVFIENRAFSSCTRLQSVKISRNLKALGWHVFSGCTALESVDIPGSLKSVNYCSFKGCSSLKAVFFHEGTERISESAFSKCYSLEAVRLSSTIITLKRYSFGKCRSLKKVCFSSNREYEIDNNGFFGVHKNISFFWPESTPFRNEREQGFNVTEDGILKGYFGNKEHLLIPDTVKTIGSYAFCGNRVTSRIEVPESVAVLEKNAFVYMKTLKSIFIKGAIRLGNGCFWGCTELEDIKMPSSLESVGVDCFGQCWSLKELDFGKTKARFSGRIAPMAYGLKKVVFPSEMVEIPENAFYYCKALETIQIPESVTKIGNMAFVGCKSLVKMTIPENVETLDLNVFNGCDSLTEIILSSHNTKVTGRTDEFCTAGIHYADEPKLKQAVIFMGIQGSGKTYYFNWHFAGKFEHINLDTLHTRNQEKILLEECLVHGKDFVVDNTNPTKADRARYIELAKEYGYRVIGYFFESKIQDCIRRNDLRDGKEKLPAKAIAATSNKQEIPSKNEGFDELYFVERSGETVMLKRDWRD